MWLFKKAVVVGSLIFTFLLCGAQDDTCHLRVSLLTCGPGQDLYSIWGHTGVRIIDSAGREDVVFNYGTFDDSDALFYIKFTRGIMMYSVTPYSYDNFMEEYRLDKRSVTEQVLNIDCMEKVKLVKALWKNAQVENKYYAYHFYADNCTTRARDMLINNTGAGLAFKDIRPLPGVSTYRQLIHSYMNSSTQGWNRFAIDVLLGNHLDEAMNNRQAMFLPDYLLKGIDSATLRGQPLVAQTYLLLPSGQVDNGSFFTPVNLFAAILVIMIVLSLLQSSVAQRLAYVLDSLFFLMTGLLGLLMLALWIFRVDNVCRNNYNLLWALPTHTMIAFAVSSRKEWVKYYWLTTAVLNGLLLVCWKWLPQEMNNSILLIIAILLFRSIARYRKNSFA